MQERQFLFYFSSYLPLNKFLSQIPVDTKLRSDDLVVWGVGVVGWSLMLTACSIFLHFRHLKNCNSD